MWNADWLNLVQVRSCTRLLATDGCWGGAGFFLWQYGCWKVVHVQVDGLKSMSMWAAPTKLERKRRGQKVGGGQVLGDGGEREVNGRYDQDTLCTCVKLSKK